jgi:predicted nucleotidyltransferase
MQNSVGEEKVKHRIDYFLSSPRRERTEVHQIIDRCESIGPSYIFGGMARDLYFFDNRKFDSDIDIVINCDRGTNLWAIFDSSNTRQNKFGGIRIEFEKWKIDVWPIHSTWAIRNGYVKEETIEGLLKSTFFNWDSIAYDLSSHRIVSSPEYFSSLQNRILDIVLDENPNPTGMIGRIIRFVFGYKAKLTSKTVDYFRFYSHLYEGTVNQSTSEEARKFAQLSTLLRNYPLKSRSDLFDFHELQNSLDR